MKKCKIKTCDYGHNICGIEPLKKSGNYCTRPIKHKGKHHAHLWVKESEELKCVEVF